MWFDAEMGIGQLKFLGHVATFKVDGTWASQHKPTRIILNDKTKELCRIETCNREVIPTDEDLRITVFKRVAEEFGQSVTDVQLFG